ncbi:hypothetical protein AB5N19_12177 [Seiridium cardinale]|uniref:Uncharacterized protein n=1 Tax=Seiridium cardinale TaxID=138064 RepID=A0ABR2Y3K3_9PEZI
MLLDLVKSLIFQILTISQNRKAAVDFSCISFEELADPGMNIETALRVLRRMRLFVPPYTHCIIENIGELQDRSDLEHMENLSQVIHEVMSLDEPADEIALGPPDNNKDDGKALTKQLKLCFISDSHVDVLEEMAQDSILEKMESNL